MAIKYEIKKRLAVITDNNGYSKELNLVAWGDNAEKIDLRIWTPEGKPGKGITLTEDEAVSLLEHLENIYR